ncbi:MAG: Omp28-related outer membrane protein [Flavobacteriales bacterium]|nr:Omp28-related outer membrane protein [Flavobacteriales bacterium]MBT6916308.1 Omp28-related outer membrane protein [Flavobacteriales bacterium]MBT7686989.1 Omp28-related outer membrane protein [Flavobacteriales bacterium]
MSESVWTPASVEAICAKEDLRSTYGNDIAIIGYHPDNIQNGGDPMYNTISSQWADIFGVNQFGRASIDRVSYNGTSITALGISNWSDTIAARINRPAVGEVTLPELLVDPNTDEIYARVHMNFTKDVIELKDFRIFCYLVEDGKVEIQLVDTNLLTGCSLFNDTLDTAFAFAHNDVVKRNPSTYEGTDNIIPNEVHEGDYYTTAYTMSIPSGVNIDDLRVVAFVADFNTSDITSNVVINAIGSNDFTEYDSGDETDPNHPNNPDNPNSIMNPANWPTAIQEIRNDPFEITVSPMPISDLGIVSFELPSKQTVEVSLYSIDGVKVRSVYRQQLAAGLQKAAILKGDLPAGIYLLNVDGENVKASHRIVIL